MLYSIGSGILTSLRDFRANLGQLHEDDIPKHGLGVVCNRDDADPSLVVEVHNFMFCGVSFCWTCDSEWSA